MRLTGNGPANSVGNWGAAEGRLDDASSSACGMPLRHFTSAAGSCSRRTGRPRILRQKLCQPTAAALGRRGAKPTWQSKLQGTLIRSHATVARNEAIRAALPSHATSLQCPAAERTCGGRRGAFGGGRRLRDGRRSRRGRARPGCRAGPPASGAGAAIRATRSQGGQRPRSLRRQQATRRRPRGSRSRKAA